jgi:hypothetical protein
VEPISDTEELNNKLNDEMVAVVAPSSTVENQTEPKLPENITQLRDSGRKRKSREDEPRHVCTACGPIGGPRLIMGLRTRPMIHCGL